MEANVILDALNSVLKDNKKRELAALRAGRKANRSYSRTRIYWPEVAHAVLPDAYKHSSGNGQFTVSRRNFYYASREEFLRRTGHEIDQNNFDRVLTQYMNQRPVATMDWRVTADPRGNIEVPNTFTRHRIPIGTTDIDRYLSFDEFEDELSMPENYPAVGPGTRFQAVLYIEKEGFTPMLQEARIAERFDLLIMSCKGQSVVAARKFIDSVCYKGSGCPLFVVHDFDKAGFEILFRLTSVSESARDKEQVKYEFENEIDVVDFGLSLADAQKYDLASESHTFKGKMNDELSNALTDEERMFLLGHRRVELNAFTCPQFIEWLVGKLTAHLPERLIPDDRLLDTAMRRAYVVAKVNKAVESLHDEIKEEAKELEVPDDFREHVKAEIVRTGDPWDIAVYNLMKPDSDKEE